MNCAPASLIQAARCFSCLPKVEFNGALIYALCQWANASEALDPDAQAFLSEAGIDPNSTEGQAIIQLVSDLKSYPAAGTKYWDRQLVLYPFVGGTAASHSYNLIDPASYQLTYHGTNPPLHSATGMKGSGVVAGSGYANTHWQPDLGQQDDVCVMVYVEERASAGANRFVFGSVGASRFTMAMEDPHPSPFIYSLNNAGAGVGATAGAFVLGSYFCQRIGDGVPGPDLNAAYLDLAWSNSNLVSAAPSALDLYLLAWNAGAPGFWSDMEMSGFSVLTQLTNAERLEYKDIWDDFEEALGRGHRDGT